jgi:hypothetical protein
MKSGLAASGRRRGRAGPGAVFISGAAALTVACGVTLGSGTPESELFQRLTVTGDFTPGAQLTLKLDYSQVYPAAYRIACDLLEPGRPTPTPPAVPTLPLGAKPSPTVPRIPKPETTPVNRVLEILNVPIGENGLRATPTSDRPFDDVTPVLESLTATFTAPEPGRYIVRCYTPVDDNNQVRKTIRIRQAS